MPKSTLDIIIEAAKEAAKRSPNFEVHAAFAAFASELKALNDEQEKEGGVIEVDQPQATSGEKEWFEDDLEAALRECGLNQETVDMAYSVVSPLISRAERRGREEERERVIEGIDDYFYGLVSIHSAPSTKINLLKYLFPKT